MHARAPIFIAVLGACGSSPPERVEPTFVAQLPVDKSVDAMAIAGDLVFAEYVGGSVPDVLYVVDVSVPDNPQLLSSQMIGGLGYKLFASGTTLFGSTGMVVNVSNPTLPTMAGTINAWRGMAQIGANYIQVDSGLHVMDLSNLLAPRELGFLALSEPARDVAVDGHYAYVANRAITAVDLSDPANPTIAGSIALPGVEWVTARDGIVYAGTYTGPYATADEIGLFVIDALTPSGLTIIGRVAETSSQGPYTVAQRMLLTPHRVHDVSDPSEPLVIGKPPLPPTDLGTPPPVHAVTATVDGAYGIWGGTGLFVIDLSP